MKRFARFYFWLFIIILILVGLFAGDLKVNALTLTSWSTQQTRVQTTYDGTDTWSSWYTINGDNPYSFSANDISNPVKSIAWHLKSSNGLSSENTYTFQFGYKATPQSVAITSYYLQNDTTGQDEDITCTQSTSSNGYHWFTCSFTPHTNYTSSQYLYVKVNFYMTYLTELKSVIRGYDQRTGTNAVITDTGSQIINNQNQNTQEIINSLTQANENLLNGLTDQNQVCKNYGINNIVLNNQRIIEDGTVQTNQNQYGISDYIKINENTKIKVKNNLSIQNRAAACFYNVNKVLISCVVESDLINNQIILIPNNANYFRFTIYKNTQEPLLEICVNGNQAVADGINDLNNTINDDNVDNPGSSISDMEDLLPQNGVITQLIALPITLFQKVLNSINGTCSQFDLGELYGTHLIMPCIDLSSYLGNSLITTIDLIISGVFVLTIARKMVKAFENFTSMKEGDVIND